MPTAYLPITNPVAGVTGWPKDQTRFVPYEKTVSCTDEETTLLALRSQIDAATSESARLTLLSQALSLTLPAVPPPPAGQVWQARNCSGSTTPDVFVESDPADFVPPVTNGGTGGPPTDGSAWTGGNLSETDDQGNAVTYSDPVILTDTPNTTA